MEGEENPLGSIQFKGVCNYFFSYIETTPESVDDSLGNIVEVNNSIVFSKELIDYIGMENKIYCAAFNEAGYIEVVADSCSTIEHRKL